MDLTVITLIIVIVVLFIMALMLSATIRALHSLIDTVIDVQTILTLHISGHANEDLINKLKNARTPNDKH